MEGIPAVSEARRQLKMDFFADTELEEGLQKKVVVGLPEGNHFRGIELK